MWVLFAFGSALFGGITSILAKCGIKETDSNVATAIRTIAVFLFSCLMAAITASPEDGGVSARCWVFLILSGLSTGASWLCYFRALQIGDINKVVPIDKSSAIITMILAMIFLGESITIAGAVSIVLIGAGTFLMIEKKDGTLSKSDTKSTWLIYALFSALFASLTSILGKIGIEGIDSNLGSAIRTGIVLIMSWAIVFISGKKSEIKRISGKELIFITLSGVATGASWLCYYRALQEGPASAVVPIDKLSILITVIFSRLVFNEHLSGKAAAGLAMLTGGTLLMTMGTILE